MSSKVKTDLSIDELVNKGHTVYAENTKTNEDVEVLGKLTLDNGVMLYVVNGSDDKIYLEYECNLTEPFYWR